MARNSYMRGTMRGMGTSYCEIVKGNDVVGFVLYHSASALAGGRISESVEAAYENPDDPKCVCGQPPDDVLIAAFYGGNFYWPAKACLTCKCIVSSKSPYGDDLVTWGWGDSLSDDQRQIHDAYHAAGWPKRGHPLGKFQET